ncbi:MAG TPA: tetratricopeptide repeat-containing glycosyltransferase family protein [Rhizomicrobium sp.]|jgi:tetratricopeptide (TPR) repeat protein|nr:tetratricopeptide repeat-containing glycosyltransferase family protein [Rhizomicrobium sp.]
MDAQTLCRQATEHHKNGGHTEAERLYLQALAIEPGNFAALHLLGVLRSQTGRKAEALELINAALAVKPDVPTALMNHGLLLQELLRPADALVSFERALALKPDFAAARYGRADALKDLQRFEEALADYDLALDLRPGNAQALSNRAGVLRALGRDEEALASYNSALAAAPGDAAIWKNRGHLLREQNRSGEALASYDQALALSPRDAEAWDDRGAALHGMKRFDEAMASFEQAIAADPDYAPAWFHKALGLLLAGDLRPAWPLLEWRYKLAGAPAPKNHAGPEWSGIENIAGKTLFVRWEEGLGDTIQFFRFVLLAAARGAKVIFSVPDRLAQLFREAGSGVEIIGAHETPPRFDYHIPLLSLPLAFGTEVETIPAATSYLRADAARVTSWTGRTGSGGFRIGVVWATTTSRSLGRSFPLGALEGLAKLPSVRLISLQKQDGLEQLNHLPPGMDVEVYDFDQGSDAFLDTAAMMENMDLIISADTSTAHLAGALGRPIWLALKYVSDWRWFLDRADSPWYPSMRLFRQQADGDWTGVFAQMQAELARRL